MSDLSSSKGEQKSRRGGAADKRRNGKADFMLLEADIRRGLAARQSMRFIYETHQAAFSFGYIQFTKYVKALIRTTNTASPSPQRTPPPPRPAAPSAIPLASSPRPHQPRQAPREEPRRFHFDPMAVDRKDLI